MHDSKDPLEMIPISQYHNSGEEGEGRAMISNYFNEALNPKPKKLRFYFAVGMYPSEKIPVTLPCYPQAKHFPILPSQ